MYICLCDILLVRHQPFTNATKRNNQPTTCTIAKETTVNRIGTVPRPRNACKKSDKWECLSHHEGQRNKQKTILPYWGKYDHTAFVHVVPPSC